jgi:hypothetical protein
MAYNRKIFTDAYIECALWAEDDESDSWAQAVLSDDARATLCNDASKFYDAHESDILAYCEGVAIAGHDLWLTRRGHGCGFWENSDDVSSRLDNAAKALGDCELYVGEDGAIHVA